MDNWKVTFTIETNIIGFEIVETFTVKELGLLEGEDFDTKEELESLLEETYTDWRNDQLAGGVEIEKGND